MVFQAPQLSQRPDHLAAWAPQAWQTWVEAGFAMGASTLEQLENASGFDLRHLEWPPPPPI
jgi:hypothetical protein